MDLQPAHIDQIRQTEEGDFLIIGAEASSAVADLKAIDKNLEVRLAGLKTTRPYFVIYEIKDEGRTHELVTTAQAYQNSFGVWEGLDHRIVEKVRQIDSHGVSGYDYVKEVEKRNQAAEKAKRDRFAETVGPAGEKAAWALRKDLNRHTRRAFIRKEIPR